MRLAIGILSLIFGIVMGLQSCAVFVGGDLIQKEELGSAGAMGLGVSFLVLVGGALAFQLPRLAGLFFVFGGLFGLIVPTHDFPDLRVWSVGALVVAVLCFLSAGRKKSERSA